MEIYTSKEVAEILNISDKSVRRYLISYFSIENGAYKISQKMLDVLKKEYLGQVSDESTIVEEFTKDEYKEFHKRLSEYHFLIEKINYLLDDLDYHKRSVEKHQEQQRVLINSITQRNFIEAKEKGFD